MKTIEVYTPQELKEINPNGFEEAHANYINDNAYDSFWTDEIMDSLKALIKGSGLKLNDWSIDAYGYSYIKIDMESEIEELQGQRALAWLENNLLSDLRIPFTGKERWNLSKYGKFYRAGMIKPCPFTGVCFDEDFLNALIQEVKDGETLEGAYSSLANVAARLFRSEIEYLNSEENFLEQEHLTYTIDGQLV